MTISAKPNRAKLDPVEQFVSRGGSVPTAATTATDAATRGPQAQHPLKFPEIELFNRLEQARKAGAVKLPRNTWILQAIAEKLEREGA